MKASYPKGPLGSERKTTLMVRTIARRAWPAPGADFGSTHLPLNRTIKSPDWCISLHAFDTKGDVGSGQRARLRERRDRFRLCYRDDCDKRKQPDGDNDGPFRSRHLASPP